jgi:hypothetical protein
VHHAQVGAEIAEKIGRYLKWSNDRIATVKHLVLHHLEDDSPLMYADGEATKAD